MDNRENAEKIKAGDVVQLITGEGPLMAVDKTGQFGGVDTSNRVRCVWFEGTEKKTDVFEFSILKRVEAAVEA